MSKRIDIVVKNRIISDCRDKIVVGGHKDNAFLVWEWTDEEGEVDKEAFTIHHNDLDDVIKALQLVSKWKKGMV